jgi:SNF2 family DNA or RNA helicase
VELHSYQQRAVDFLRRTPRAGLFLDMGYGKTATTLSALTPDHLPALVVAPKRVAEHVWPVEQQLWRPDLTLALAAGPARQRAEAIARGADITVIGRDNLADVKGRYRTLILDELSGFKTRTTLRWKAGRVLAGRAEYCWGLTGTPAPNGLMDLWAQVFLLDGGERLGDTLGGFRSRFFYPGQQLPNGIITSWIPRPEAQEKIQSLISDICLSMDGELDLPPVVYNTVSLDLPPAARRAYQTLKRDLVVSLDLLGGDVHSATNAAVLTNRLSQLSAGFLYDDDGLGGWSQVHTEKIEALREVIDGTGSPVLVFYHYKAEREMILAALPQARCVDDPGCIEAWNRGEVSVLLAHPASAGHGLNLQHGGHTVVWTTLPWALELWQQGNARLARQGQQHPVIVHVLQAADTIDAVIRARLESKTYTQDMLLDHLSDLRGITRGATLDSLLTNNEEPTPCR